MKIAIEGCCHGQLEDIYREIARLETLNKYKVDLLLVCGDLQAVRNYNDLQCMAVPDKYKALGEFYKYYSGEAIAPITTICIGGNHEASNYFQELYHGGWAAPNIYFIGHAGCIEVNGIKIAGASGIFNQRHFHSGLYERVPYANGQDRSIYHTREYNIRRLSLLAGVDIFLSHDWPASIEHFGDLAGLLRRKRHFQTDIQKGVLGSPPLMGLLRALKPKWWFAAHMHVRFEAVVMHGPPLPAALVANPDEISIDDEEIAETNPDEITLDDEEECVDATPLPHPPPVETQFLALDKCLPQRKFLEVIDYPTADTSTPTIQFNAEWLAITKAFHPLLSLKYTQPNFPLEDKAREMVAQAVEWVDLHVSNKKVEEIQKFVITAPSAKGPEKVNYSTIPQPSWCPNPQTRAFCDMLGIADNIGS